MKKLLLLMTTLLFSLSLFAANADLCDANRDAGAKDNLQDYKCTADDVKNKRDGCTSVGQVVKKVIQE